MTKKRIFLVDDHPLVREWLTNLINQQSDMLVCGEAEDATQTLSLMGATQPHLIVVDLSLKAGSGIDLIKDIKRLHPDLFVLVLSMHDESLYAERALRAGARGYIMKREVTKTIISAIPPSARCWPAIFA
jgi:DNA-binding NarL/FixJ family response regulator